MDITPETENLYQEIESLFGADKFKEIITLLIEFSTKINKN
jgi:hypothetical protein